MPVIYLTATGCVQTVNSVELLDEFVKAPENKTIIITNLKLFNSNGQVDVGAYLCGNFADSINYSTGLMNDFVMATNNTHKKQISIDNNCRRLSFYFRDYKGNYIKDDCEYYYLLELMLVYNETKIIE